MMLGICYAAGSMIIREKAYPRGGLVGNPSDGYFGKTIALAFTNFHAEVILYESPDLEILPTINGIRAGRDEVLEEAVSAVLGREFRMEPPLR